MPIDKQALRRELLIQRAAIPPEEHAASSAALCERICAHPWFRAAKTVLGFYPVRGEPDILPALQQALVCGKTIALPRCTANGSMTFHPVDDDWSKLTPGLCGIPEPADNYELQITTYDLCFVPGLAFDRRGFRLGYGKGYYDRFLPAFPGRSMGVCLYDFLLEEIPAQPHDIAVNSVETDQMD